MKKLLSLILAAIIFASVLTSCAGGKTASGAIGAALSNVRLTSSDAADAAAWLSARLGEKLTRRIVIGTDADGYAVDLSSLEADGYFIRSFGREDVLFAKTPDGLDRAVRKYAKTVEAGEKIADVTYHEGFRVDRLTVAGNDISTYAIVRVTEDDPCVGTAASELSTYIEKACGVKLPVCTEADFASTGAAHKIAISSGDESLGDEGFQILVSEDGTLSIIGGKWRGSLYGVYDLLEEQIGWRFIAVPDSYYDLLVPKDRQEFLYEAEHIDVTSAANRTEIPSIPIRGGCDGLRQRNTYTTLEKPEYGGYGFIIRVCHGLQNNHDLIFSGDFAGLYRGYGAEAHQPCFTNEDILDAIDAYAMDYVQTRLDAGQQIGKEIICVDVAHWDGGAFCTCKRCEKVRVEEGGVCGAMLRMANRVAALLDENYPGVSSGILAYGVTERLPKITHPAHNVYVSFTHWPSGDKPRIIPCNNHCVSGEECGNSIYNNKTFARDLDEWLEVTDPSMLQIWYYPFEDYISYCSPILTNMLKDMKYFADKGIAHVYYCMERNASKNSGLMCEGLFEYLGSRYMWDADMTEDEALSYIREWFDIIFGEDAGEVAFELAMFAERAGDVAGCWNCHSSYNRVSYDYVAKHADAVWERCMLAPTLADDDEGEEYCAKYVTGFMCMVMRGCYNDMYRNGTDEQRAVFTERYREYYGRMCQFTGASPEAFDPDVAP